MRSARLRLALISCLGLGAADLWALNVAVLPELLPVGVARHELEDKPLRRYSNASSQVGLVSVQEALTSLATPKAPEDNPHAQRKEPVLVLSFETSSHRVDQSAQGLLRAHLERLRSARRLLVTGHTDASGTPELNENLSKERALSVVRALGRGGVPRARIEVAWFGSRQPPPFGEQKRVEIHLGEMP